MAWRGEGGWAEPTRRRLEIVPWEESTPGCIFAYFGVRYAIHVNALPHSALPLSTSDTPRETLERIWDQFDFNQDGLLCEEENGPAFRFHVQE